MRHLGPKVDLAGRRFGRWAVLGLSGDRSGRLYKWTCRCDCGTVRDVVSATLVNGASQSCGCLHREMARELNTVHGGKGTPEYRAWKHMRERCNNPNDKRYENYGGRGIRVCDRWNDFTAFMSDLGPRPSRRHSIERIDVNGHYEPGNVKWATVKEQARNKTTTLYVEVDGRIKKVSDLAETLGVKYDTLLKRAKRGSLGVRFVPAP